MMFRQFNRLFFRNSFLRRNLNNLLSYLLLNNLFNFFLNFLPFNLLLHFRFIFNNFNRLNRLTNTLLCLLNSSLLTFLCFYYRQGFTFFCLFQNFHRNTLFGIHTLKFRKRFYFLGEFIFNNIILLFCRRLLNVNTFRLLLSLLFLDTY